MDVSMALERQTAPTQAPLTRDQVEACCRLHRRIRVRTDVIRRLLEPDPARDEMMGSSVTCSSRFGARPRRSRRCSRTSEPGPAPAAGQR